MDWMRSKARLKKRPEYYSHPLRRVLGRVAVQVETGSHIELIQELYECGHTRLPKSDMIGPTNAVRRRCHRCAKGIPPDPKYLKMAQEWKLHH
jgi:hypothetical protein